MAIVRCKECGSDVSTKAQTCPKCGAKRPKQAGLFGIIVVLLFGLFIFQCTKTSTTLPSNGKPEKKTAAPGTAELPKASPGWQWTYFQNKDDMSGGQIFEASVTSSNAVNFSFPYQGEQHATLQIRTHPRFGRDVILDIERGQFLCRSYQDCQVLVRFDEEAPISYAGRGPSDSSTTVVFIRNYDSFMSKMIKAKTVRISTDVYQQGSPSFEFNVERFDQEKYKPKPAGSK